MSVLTATLSDLTRRASHGVAEKALVLLQRPSVDNHDYSTPFCVMSSDTCFTNSFTNSFLFHVAGEPLIAPGAEGLSSLMLANAAYLSAWTGQKISLPMDDEAYAAELAGHMEKE